MEENKTIGEWLSLFFGAILFYFYLYGMALAFKAGLLTFVIALFIPPYPLCLGIVGTIF